MLRTSILGLAILLVAGSSAYVSSGAAPAPATSTPAPAPAAATTSATVPSLPGVDPKVAEAVKPTLEVMTLGAKALELYDEEMAKPDKTRNAAQAITFKHSAARFYLSAMQKAKAAEAQFKNAADIQFIADRFENPCREKAAVLLLDLAVDARQKNDLRGALGFYKQVQQLQPANETAKSAIQEIEAILKNPLSTSPAASTSSGTDSKRNP